MNPTPTQKTTISVDTGTLVRIVLFALGIFLLFKLSNIILIILTSIVIASFIEHVVRRLERRKIPRTVTVVLLYVLIIGLFTLLSYFFLPILVKEVSSLVELIGKLFAKSTFLDSVPLDTFTNTKTFFDQLSSSASSSEFVRNTQLFLGKLSTGVGNTIGTFFGSVANIVLIAVISFYLSIQEKGVENFLRIITPVKNELYVISLWQRTERKIALWIRGQMLLGLIVGAILFIGLSIIGVKYALLLAVLAALSELIPYGLLLAFIPTVAIAYSEGSLPIAGWTILLYAIVQQLENYVLVPVIVKRSIGISPLVVIIALLVGATLAGFWGVLLAIPTAVCLMEYLSDLEKTKESARYIHEKEHEYPL